MSNQVHELLDLRDRLRTFAEERDWDQFHTPRNLAVAVSVEAAELVEPFRWGKSGELAELTDSEREGVRLEAADVLLCLVRFADKAGIDLYAAALEKLEINRQNYPADLVRGGSRRKDLR